jgi:uncharacterized protein
VAAELRPVPDAPALLVTPDDVPGDPWLAIADLHLGLAAVDHRRGLPAATTARAMAEELLRLCRATGARRVLVAGDVKHPVTGTPRVLRPEIFRFFATVLEGRVPIEVVLGNHDPGLVPWLPKEVVVHRASGIVRDGVGVFHGHRWPSQRVLNAPRLVVGHLHPGVRLAPSPDRGGGKERCWVRVAFDPVALRPRRRRRHVLRARELIVLPAFNPLAGAEALNRERPRRGRSFLFQRFLARGTTRAYLLDGTDLGPIPTTAPPATAAPRQAPPAR